MPPTHSFTRSSIRRTARNAGRSTARRLHAAHEKGAHMGRHHNHHGRGGPHRQRARRGAVRNAVLTLLAERPMHGYELITELESRSGGRWRPSAGSIYPALTRMEQHGLLISEEVDDKRMFTLTDSGREALAELRSSQGADAPPPWEESGHGGRGDLRRHVSELVGQARQIGRFGTPSQIEQAATVFEDAKRSLYAILAADDPAESGEQEPDARHPDAATGPDDAGGG